VQWALITIGVVLVGVLVVARFHREAGSREDLERFDRLRQQAGQTSSDASIGDVVEGHALPTELPVDTELWSPGRVAKYEESLSADFDGPLAVLRIPKIDLEVAVLDGTDELTLNRAVGRIAGTATVETMGNLGIAGHRDGFFRGLKDVVVGDEMELVTLTANSTFVIDDISIVKPTDVHVLEPTDVPTITLVTCDPFYCVGKAPERCIVKASLRE
jgi:sortase A